jgi:hypothetical protein
MRKLVLTFLAAIAALAHAAVSPSRAASDLTSNNLASQLRGRCVLDGAMTAHYGIDGSYLVSGLLASGQAFSRSGRWSAHGNQRTLYFDDGDWRRDFLVVTPQGKIRFVSDGGIFIGGAPRPKGDIGYLTFCGEG